jgi:hypothetical protein
MSEQEAKAKDALLEKSEKLEKLADTILRAAEGRRPLPVPQGDALKQIADLTSECEEALDGVIDDSFSKETLEVLATALGAIRGGIDSLVVFQALDGTSYETRTVAND